MSPSNRTALHGKRVAAVNSSRLQASAAKVPEEEATFPGEWPGIYACDVRNLLDVYVLTARARLAALDGDVQGAQVSDSAVSPPSLWYLLHSLPQGEAGSWIGSGSR